MSRRGFAFFVLGTAESGLYRETSKIEEVLIMMKRYTWLVAISLILLLALTGCVAKASSDEPTAATVISSTAMPQVVSSSLPIGGVADWQETLENIYAQANPSV